ncbi:MAG: flavodoxin family protein [Bacillota bacterium]
MLKIIALAGSPRKGATEYIAQQALDYVKEVNPDIQTELITLRGKDIKPCNGCGYCKRNKTWCILKDDMQELFDKFIEADGYVVVSPVYIMGATPQLHAFLSRMRPAMHCFPGMLRSKFAAPVTVGGARNGGQEMANLDIVNMLVSRSINIVANEAGGFIGGKVWSKDNGAEGAAEDEIGMKTVRQQCMKLAEISMIYKMGKEAYEKEKAESGNQ